jgi:maltose O-acetyltransferase
MNSTLHKKYQCFHGTDRYNPVVLRIIPAVRGRNKKGMEEIHMKTELEKLKAGEYYCYDDPEVDGLKDNAIRWNKKFNDLDPMDYEGQRKMLKENLGAYGDKAWLSQGFRCDNGRNIFIGKNFTGNYNIIMLDVREIHIGDNVMIGPNTMIITVNHPLTPKGRREHLGIAKPVTIGNDVWIGGNCTILPGVHIGNNVVVAAGAVVTKDIPDNTLVGGVPARKIKDIENDVED